MSSSGSSPMPASERRDRVRLRGRPMLGKQPHEGDRVGRLGDADPQQDRRRDVGDPEGAHGTSIMAQT